MLFPRRPRRQTGWTMRRLTRRAVRQFAWLGECPKGWTKYFFFPQRSLSSLRKTQRSLSARRLSPRN
jgi:hypothetical protein